MKFKVSFTRFNLFLATTFWLVLLSAAADAQVIAFDTVGLVGNEASLNSTTTDTNLNISQLTRGGGINPSSLVNAFNSDNFTLNGTFADAVTNADFLQFTVSPKSGFKVSLSTLNANFRRSGTGPNMFQYQYSLNGFTTVGVNVGSAITFTDTNTNGIAQPQIDLSSVPALQNVAFPNTITFRLYGWAATNTSGTFAIGRLAGNDLAIGGTTAAVTTAAVADISGRVTNGRRGLENVTVTLSGGLLTEPISVTTNAVGRYHFSDVPVGETYLLTAASKRHTFSQPTMVFTLNGNLANVNFVGMGW